MKSEEIFLNSLLDFSNIPSKRATDYGHYHMISTSDQNKSNVQQHKKSNTDCIPQQLSKPSQSDVASNSNQKLLKSFNALRQKLSVSTRQNITLKQALSLTQQQLNQQRQKQSYYMNQVQSYSKRLTAVEQQANQYKMRLNGVKQAMHENEKRNDELQKNKVNVQRLVDENRRLKQELRLSMQISVQQKLQFEQQIQQLRLKQIEQTNSNQQAQNQLYQKTREFISLQNQYKKLKISYEEQVFTKKISSETMILGKQNKQLKLIVDDLQYRLKNEKNKKYELQTRLLQLQQKVRLFGTRTDIYQGQLQSVMKKIKKVQKDHVSAKKQANQALNQKLSWQQKFYHSSIILQELISRVKRQLKGDAVQLAKTCQFRLNKIKNNQKLQNINNNVNKINLIGKRRKSSSIKKLRSQSMNRKLLQYDENGNNQQQSLNLQNNKIVSFSNTHANDFKQLQQSKKQQLSCKKQLSINKKEQLSCKKQQLLINKTVLKQRPYQNIILNNSNNNNGLDDIKKRLFNNDNKQTQSKSIALKNYLLSKQLQKSTQPLSRSMSNTNINNNNNELNLQVKIRKQRQIMQKKLRQKILYHKIQDATSSPIKNILTNQYFNLNQFNLY